MGSYHQSLVGSLCLLLLACQSAFADEQAISHRFSGFASLGLVSNDNPDLIFRREIIQGEGSRDGTIEWRNDSLLGLQWQTQWSYQFETTAQLILKDRFNNNLANSIEWAFMRYRPLDGFDIRVGRLGTDIFMLSDYRQVGYALPWVRPPHDTYGLLSFHHFDGIDFNKRFDIQDSTLNIKTFYGRSDQEYPTSTNGGRYRLAFEGGGSSINWELNEWKLRYSYADVEVQNNNASLLISALNAVSPLWPEAPEIGGRFNTKGKHFKYHQLGMTYDNNTWWLQAEATNLNSKAAVIYSTRHFYLSIGRRIDAFTLYATRGSVHSLQDPTQITAPTGYPANISQQLFGLAAVAEKTLNSSRSSQDSFGIGIRWDFTSKMAFKLQADKFNVDKYGDALWIKPDSNYLSQQQTANVISFSLDVLF
jgi:hypothetical protein